MLSILFSCTEIHIYFPSYFLPHCINGRRPNIYYYLFFQLTKPNNIKIWCLCIKNRKKNTLVHYALFLSLKKYSLCVLCTTNVCRTLCVSVCECVCVYVHCYTTFNVLNVCVPVFLSSLSWVISSLQSKSSRFPQKMCVSIVILLLLLPYSSCIGVSTETRAALMLCSDSAPQFLLFQLFFSFRRSLMSVEGMVLYTKLPENPVEAEILCYSGVFLYSHMSVVNIELAPSFVFVNLERV